MNHFTLHCQRLTGKQNGLLILKMRHGYSSGTLGLENNDMQQISINHMSFQNTDSKRYICIHICHVCQNTLYLYRLENSYLYTFTLWQVYEYACVVWLYISLLIQAFLSKSCPRVHFDGVYSSFSTRWEKRLVKRRIINIFYLYFSTLTKSVSVGSLQIMILRVHFFKHANHVQLIF